ncbi:hypothetical protein [Streptomyces sp. NBC_01465]|uniref:hypothetical protein n=1 Tax=Streptomyces sp. NBC_01465 TaxID=2903878 RepID=UPI002E30D055|nr:hypothetical protein [Streptomyces sp. NBC_01465]
MIAKGDVTDHEITVPGKDDVFKPGQVSVDKSECKPVAQALSSLPASEPKASVQRLVVHKSAKAKKGMPSTKELGKMTEKQAQDATLDSLDITKTMTSLWSYDGQGAEQALTTLREAAKKCAAGFTMTLDGEKQQVTKVEEAALSAGDEGASWTVTAEDSGNKVLTDVAVFRKGATLAGFSSFNIAAAARGKAFEPPTDVITAQAAKLR